MSSPSRIKGVKFESQVRDYLRSHGYPAERVPAGMKHDRGDLSGLTGWAIEIKYYPHDLARAVRDGLHDLEVEQANAAVPHGAVIVKRSGVTDPGRQLVLMELWQYVGLLQQTQDAAK